MKRFLLVFILTVCGAAQATVYYISPSGNNSNAGTSSGAPWLTFVHAWSVMVAGDTLTLLNGSYTATNGFPNINCSSGAPNGTSSSPITVIAQSQRQAHIVSDGTPAAGPFQISHCSYWIISGLHITDADSASETSENATLSASFTDHLQLLYNIVDHTNQKINEHAIGLVYSNTNALVAYNEVYYFHRHAFIDYSNTNTSTNRNVFVQNYSNARGWGSGSLVGNGTSFMAYGSGYTLFENDISENNALGAGMDAEAITGGDNVTNSSFLGLISFDDNQGIASAPHQSGTCPSNLSFTNDAVIMPLEILAEQRGVQFGVLTNISMFQSNAGTTNFFQDANNFSGCTPSVAITNSDMLNGGSTTGYNNALDGSCTPGSCTLGTLTLNYDGYFGSGSYSANATVTHQFSTNPALGSCYLWVPASSPAKGAGLSGADIGANVLYAYVGGFLTATQLWDSSGELVNRGAIVTGLNDQPGESLENFGARVNINQGGCSFPAGYLAPVIYYVDYVGGSDSNNGLTKTTAWQHAPGMTNCLSVCLSTTPLSGNSYIFKGGVTWISSYPWTLTGGVNYTTDATWYTGGSFTRPTFDDGHADPGATGMINSSGAGFITLNDFDIVNCGTSGTANSDKCLVWENDHDITISNSVFATQSWIANYFVFDAAGSYSNFTFSGNDFSATSGAMWFASAQASTSEHNVRYVSNTFHDFTSQLGGGVHGDGAWHYFSVPASDATQYVDGMTFCDNRFYGDFRVSFSGGGGMTAFFFTEGSFSGTLCNNDMSYSPAQANMFDALIDLSGNSNTKAKTVGIYNNSLAAIGTNAMSAAYDFSGMVSGDVITSENNIIYAPQYAIYLEDSATATAFASDYNLLNSSSGDMDVAGSFKSYAQWQGLGYDVHGSLGTSPSWTAAPGNETLQAGSPAIGAGLNLTSLGISFLTFDIAGIPRPSSAAWDIGAYQYASVPFGPVAPAPLGIASLQQ